MSDVLITGLFALAGVLIGLLAPMLQQRHASRHEHRTVLRERYEQLAVYVSEVVILKGQEHLADTRSQELVASAFRAHALAVVYFPELEAKTDALAGTAVALCVAAQESSAMTVEGNSTFLAAFAACIDARRAVQEDLKSFATKYTLGS